MSKMRYLIGLGLSGLMWSQMALANWQSECQTIESQGPASGACSSIQSRVSGLQPYAPLQPFHDLTVDGSTLSSKFPWGTPVWASTGTGSTSSVLPESGTDTSGTSSTTGTSNDTFQ